MSDDTKVNLVRAMLSQDVCSGVAYAFVFVEKIIKQFLYSNLALVTVIKKVLMYCFSMFSQISKEGDSYEVLLKVAKLSKLVDESVGDDESEETLDIPLPNVKGVVLGKVIEYCQHYVEEPMTEITTPLPASTLEAIVQPWYCEFVRLEHVLLFELVTAANYMNIQPLLDLTCLAVSVMIKGKSADEIRKIFNISSDFSPEEQAQVQEENKWCEQPPANN